jgi:hypothetical protein
VDILREKYTSSGALLALYDEIARLERELLALKEQLSKKPPKKK